MQDRTLRRLALAGAVKLCLLGAPLHAQVDPARQLVEQGRYWHDQGRSDLAADAWRKLLGTDPVQPDALLGLGLIDAAQGRTADARRRLEQLQRAHPEARQTRQLRNALEAGAPSGEAMLRNARAAGNAGRYDDAVRYYDTFLDGDRPTGGIGLEYYQVLAGTRDGWERARDGLRRLRDQAPGDPAVALALARVLTYREPSRREGIGLLRGLSGDADVAADARAALRQALLWLDATPADAALYRDFLQAAPDDTQVAARLQDLQRAPSDTASAVAAARGARVGESFRALDAGDLTAAERGFAEVLRAQPNEAQALGGLGSVRLRQQRFDEAYELLARAATRDARWREPRDTAQYWTLLRQADAARARGDTAAALEAARRAVALRPNEATGHAELGALSTRRPEEAEAHFQRALALDAGNAGALQGLIALYSEQGRGAEATALYERLSPQQREGNSDADALRANVQRARARQALETGDLAGAQAELEAALVERPADPWVRLDLARLYARAGRADHARSVMESVLAMPGDDPEALFVGALYAQEDGDWSTVYRNLERIPAARRSAEADALRETAWLELRAREAARLREQGRLAEAQQVLRQAEATLGARVQDPAVLAVLAGAYADGGDNVRALTLARQLVSGTPDLEARLQYAGVLLRARQDAELSAVLRQLGGQPMSPDQARRYRDLATGYTLRQVDALREVGNLEAAYEAIAPLLAQDAQDTDVLSALARMYAAAGDHGQALGLYQRVLQQRPSDPGVLIAAAATAAQGRDLSTAERYLAQAMQIAPDSPDVLVAAGRVYRDAGQRRKAERYFQAALDAQERHAGTRTVGLAMANERGGPSVAAGSFNPFAGMTGGLAPMPFASRPAHVAAMPSAAPEAFADASFGAPASAPLPAAPPASLPAGAIPPPVVGGVAAGPLSMPVAGDGPAGAASVPGAAAPLSREASSALPPPVSGTGQPLLLAAPGRAPATPRPSVSTGNPVLDELRALRAENSSSLQAGAAYRTRDGEAGLGRLDDVEMPLLGEFAVGDGRIVARVTPTLLDAGEVGTAYDAASRFGAGPMAALSDALAGDRAPLDALVQADLFQLMLTEGDTAATRQRLLDQAEASGEYQRLFNQTDPALTFAQRTGQAQAALFASPVPAYVLGNDLSSMTIGAIAGDVLGDAVLAADLSAEDRARLQALAQGTSANLTAAQLGAGLEGLAAQGVAGRRIPVDDSGVGVAVGYRQGGFHADIGSTPLGLQERNVVGGVGYEGRAGRSFSYGAEASRRAITDSLLSFGGVEDPRTGATWGGVTATGVRLSSTLDNGLVGGYANLSASRLEGRNVADNDHQQVDLGVYVHAVETDNQSLTAGINLTAMRYDRNLSGFTFGHGGYFSPQAYYDLGFPVRWSGRAPVQRMNWSLDASVGVQHFSSDPSPYFPTDPALQQMAYDAASLAALLGVSPGYVEPVYAGTRRTGASYNVAGNAEWQVAPQLFLGSRLVFNNARDYNQFTLNAYLRFVLDRLGTPLDRRPQPLTSPYGPDAAR